MNSGQLKHLERLREQQQLEQPRLHVYVPEPIVPEPAEQERGVVIIGNDDDVDHNVIIITL